MVVGQGDMGQLGLGEEVVEKKKPFPVGGALQGLAVVEVVCGGMHSVALTSEGRVSLRLRGGRGGREVSGEREREGGRERGEEEEGEGAMVEVVCGPWGDIHSVALTSKGG